MLILNRINQQTLYIGDDITIEVLEVNGHQVRLGITAPKSTPVVREELLRRNPNFLSESLTNKQAHQEVVMQSCAENMMHPPESPATTPKVVYKRRKKLMDRH